MKKLAIITTHPIQYNAPFFALLHKRQKITIKVFYTWSQAVQGEKYDPGFGHTVAWDIPFLEDYPWQAVENTSSKPDSASYNGIVNPTLIKTVGHFNPDAILVYGWNFKSHLQLMRHYKGEIKILFRGDSTLLNEASAVKTFLRKLVLRLVYRYLDVALYAGQANKAYFKFAGLRESQLVFMPHAIENQRFEPENITQDDINSLKQKFNIPLGNVVLLFSGKLSDNKNLYPLCAIVSAMKGKAVSLLIVGSGALEQRLKQEFGTSDNIHFAGFQNQELMPLMYAVSDCVVLPSKKINETWGLCLNEGMAAGKAVIASDGCGAAYDLVEQGRNGYIFPADNFDVLKERIEYLVANPERTKQMGLESEKIIANYSFENGCMAIEKIVQEIA